jgi:serine/threonine protein kinase
MPLQATTTGTAPEAKAQKILESRVPDRIGKYVIINEVGRGSTGTVYLSHDSYYGRDVAIKVYNQDSDASDERAKIARKMFLSEAHMVGMLQHPHILPIYDAGEENGRCYIVTEHVHGARTLSAYCRPDNLLRVDDVVEIMFKCAKALHYAHTRGVIHRDIKPSNIMLTQDSDVRIIDFGIALVADSEISRIEGIAGSPSYMSPEQVQSLELTHHSDLYSLGAVMYELLTGIRPFRAGNLVKLLHQIVYDTPPPIHTQRKDVPEELEEIVAQAMLKTPDKRQKSGADFAAELTRVHQRLREQNARIDQQEQFDVLRRLRVSSVLDPALPTESPDAFKLNVASNSFSPTTFGTWCPAGVALATTPRGELIPLSVSVGEVPAVSITDTVFERSLPT